MIALTPKDLEGKGSLRDSRHQPLGRDAGRVPSRRQRPCRGGHRRWRSLRARQRIAWRRRSSNAARACARRRAASWRICELGRSRHRHSVDLRATRRTRSRHSRSSSATAGRRCRGPGCRATWSRRRRRRWRTVWCLVCPRATRARRATLYILDAATGKPLFTSGDAVTGTRESGDGARGGEWPRLLQHDRQHGLQLRHSRRNIDHAEASMWSPLSSSGVVSRSRPARSRRAGPRRRTG